MIRFDKQTINSFSKEINHTPFENAYSKTHYIISLIILPLFYILVNNFPKKSHFLRNPKKFSGIEKIFCDIFPKINRKKAKSHKKSQLTF